MVRVGQCIADRYIIIKEIGHGGTSVVYLVSDRHLNKNFAIKEIRKEDFAEDSNMVGKLINEANIMNRLNHPMLPRIIDVIDKKEYVYVVMDYIQGKTLNEVMKQNKTIPPQYVIHWFRQLCEVLTYLHMSKPPIIYRDLKPSNIILTADGSIHLIDFGAAREYNLNNKNRSVALNWGTRGYAAPEQAMMTGVADARSDIYSLGVTMHYLLTGVDPTEINSSLSPIRQYNPSFSTALEAIIEKCTQFEQKNRYQNCQELLFELNRLDHEKRNEKKGNSHILTIISVIIAAIVFLATMFIALLSTTSLSIGNPLMVICHTAGALLFHFGFFL